MPGHYYIPALYNAAIKNSVYECFITHAFHILCTYTQNIMNALLECIKFYLVHIGNVLLESIHLTCIQLFVITVCLLFCYRNWTCCSIISQAVCSCDQNH